MGLKKFIGSDDICNDIMKIIYKMQRKLHTASLASDNFCLCIFIYQHKHNYIINFVYFSEERVKMLTSHMSNTDLKDCNLGFTGTLVGIW